MPIFCVNYTSVPRGVRKRSGLKYLWLAGSLFFYKYFGALIVIEIEDMIEDIILLMVRTIQVMKKH